MELQDLIKTIFEIIDNPSDLRGIITYHGKEEGTTELLDFSNYGAPFTDGTACVWSKQRDITDEAGHYNGTEEIAYGSFKTIPEAVAHILLQMMDGENEFHAETF